MNNRALVELVDVNLERVEQTSSTINLRSTQCINKEATSAKLRCSLSSNLIHLKSVSNVEFNFAGINLAGISSEIKMNFNKDFLLMQSNGNTGKLLLLNYKGTWYMSENTIDSFSFESDKVSNSNVIDAIIPPASCFNMKMKETIDKYKITYTAVAKMAVYSSTGDRYTGSQLIDIRNGVKSNAEIFDGKLIKIPISGYIDINVIGADSNDIEPCL